MPHQLLFVCAANVCRSPLMELTFTDSLEPREVAAWKVISRGTSVTRQAPMCDVTAALSGRASTDSHKSLQVAGSDVDRQDLIITASRDERARLAKMAPSARTRTFTLKEAVMLSGPGIESFERDRVRRISAGDNSELADYAAILHQRRGRLLTNPEPRVRLPWSKQLNPQDVPDVHHGNGKRHTDTLVEMRDLVRLLQGQIRSYLT